MRTLIRRKRLSLLAYLFVSLVFFGVAYIADSSRQALCAQRADLDQRIAVTGQVLEQHPTGPIFGIPRKYILDGHQRNIQTRKNLSVLICF